MFSDLEGLCGKYETGWAERKGRIIHRKESSWFGLALLLCSCVNEPKKHKEKSKGLWRQVGREGILPPRLPAYVAFLKLLNLCKLLRPRP